MEWYYAENSQQKGPVDKEALQRMHAHGVIGDKTLVWCESMSSWQPYGQMFKESSFKPVSSVPLPPQSLERERDPNISFDEISSGMTLGVLLLCLSVLLTCLLPCAGILPLIPAVCAVIFSSQVETSCKNGHYSAALSNSRTAKIFRIITIGLILLMFLTSVLLLILFTIDGGFENSDRARFSHVRSDMRMLETAIESYFVDYNAYPQHLRQITTPIAYIDDIPEDAFSPDNPIQYMHVKMSVDGETKTGWILWSIGPDGYNDVDVDHVEERLNRNPFDPASVFSDQTYDPRNGSESEGDIFRFGGSLLTSHTL